MICSTAKSPDCAIIYHLKKIFFLNLGFRRQKGRNSVCYMTEGEIIEGLLARDEAVTYDFFYTFKEKSCRRLLTSIISYVFSYHVEYEEAVSEFYAYIMADDGKKLRQIQDRNTLFGWIKISATRFFIKKRDNLIENSSQEALMAKAERETYVDDFSKETARKDVMNILSRMKNKRYAYVIWQLILLDREPDELARSMNITTANLYNIKKRAMAEFTRVATKDVMYYGK